MELNTIKRFRFNPNTTRFPLTQDQINALEGEGTPNASNKFTTKDFVTGLIEAIPPSGWESHNGGVRLKDSGNTPGYFGTAEGVSTSCGNFAHAEGFNTNAGGDFSHAEGQSSNAPATGAHAEGGLTLAFGQFSHAEGYESKANGNTSHAEGYYCNANGDYSHAEGSNCVANGYYSHAEGYYCQAQGTLSHAEGSNNMAIGQASHVEGFFCHAEGDFSHAQGYQCYATGIYSHVEGSFNTSSGEGAHAEGNNNIASGYASHAQGFYTSSTGTGSHCGGVGYHNLTDIPLLAIGIAAFNHSANNEFQINGHGALANYSAILGGCNGNIPSSSQRSVLLGGENMKATPGTNDTVFAPRYESLLAGEGIVMVSPDGTRFKLTISNAGAIQITNLT